MLSKSFTVFLILTSVSLVNAQQLPSCMDAEATKPCIIKLDIQGEDDVNNFRLKSNKDVKKPKTDNDPKINYFVETRDEPQMSNVREKLNFVTVTGYIISEGDTDFLVFGPAAQLASQSISNGHVNRGSFSQQVIYLEDDIAPGLHITKAKEGDTLTLAVFPENSPKYFISFKRSVFDIISLEAYTERLSGTQSVFRSRNESDERVGFRFKVKFY